MFRFVYSVSLCCSVYCLCVNVYWTTDIGISGHFSTTLTEYFPCFCLSSKANTRVKLAKTGHCLHFPVFSFFFCYVCSVLRILFTVCVNVYCTAATGCQPNVYCTAATGCQPNVYCTAATGCVNPMCTALLPPGVNPISVKINNTMRLLANALLLSFPQILSLFHLKGVRTFINGVQKFVPNFR
jgi:hypothetical protein